MSKKELDTKIKKLTDSLKNKNTNEDLREIKELLVSMNDYLSILVEFEETRKRMHPTSEELFPD